MALIMLPSMVINSYGAQPTDTSGLQLYQLSLGNLGATGLNNDTIRPLDLGPASILYDSLPACEWDRPSYAWFYGFSDFIASVLFLVCFLWLKHYELKSSTSKNLPRLRLLLTTLSFEVHAA